MSETNSSTTTEVDADKCKRAESVKEEANAYFKSKSISVMQVSWHIGLLQGLVLSYNNYKSCEIAEFNTVWCR